MAKKSYPKGMTEMEWKRKQGMELLRMGIKLSLPSLVGS